MNKRTTVLIAGAGGYIGSEMVDVFLKKGYEIIALDRYFFGNPFEGIQTNPHLSVIKDDIRTCNEGIFKKADIVINLASISNDPASELDKNATNEINYKGAIRLANLAKKHNVKRFIQASSCSVYGFGEGTLTEKSQTHPLSEYAKSKIDSEKELLKLSSGTFSVSILRLATVFGASKGRMRFDLIVNVMTLLAWKNRKIFIMGGGNQWRPLIHIQDVITAFEIILLEKTLDKVQGKIYNVGSNRNNFQVFQIANKLRQIFPDLVVEHIPDDPDPRSYKVGFDKFHKTFSPPAHRTIEDGILEIKHALDEGELIESPQSYTLQYYKYLLEAERILSSVKLNGKIL